MLKLTGKRKKIFNFIAYVACPISCVFGFVVSIYVAKLLGLEPTSSRYFSSLMLFLLLYISIVYPTYKKLLKDQKNSRKP